MNVKTETPKSFANTNYEADFFYAIQLNRGLLRPMGLWPMNLSFSNDKWIPKFLNIACSFVLLAVILPGCIDIFTSDLQMGLEKAGPLSFVIVNLLYYWLYLIHRQEIRFCLKMMHDDWRSVNNQDNREIMLKSVSIARNFILICSSFMYAGSLSFTCFFPLLDNFASSGNVTTRNTAFPAMYLIIDPQVRPYYDVVFCLQVLGAFTCCSVTSGICSIAITFVMHICGQLEILNGFLHLLVTETLKKLQTTDEKLSLIVQRHLRSLRFAQHLENIMNEICLVEFFSSCFGICLIGYYIASELSSDNNITKIVVYCLLLISYIFNIFIYCFLSELLLTKCEDVGKQTYMIPWNSLPKKKALDLILIIIISSNPAKLSAGKIVTFSMGCFCNVMKVSATYLNFLFSFIN